MSSNSGGQASGGRPPQNPRRPVPAEYQPQPAPPPQSSDERYWTDYLRIALPIAGLLLLLGVFWYWASSFIGDDSTTPPTQQAQVISTPVAAPTTAPTASGGAVVVTPLPTVAGVVTAAPVQPTTPPTEPTTAPVEGFAVGDIVTCNDGDVNMRSQPSTTGDVVVKLAQGTELTILDGTSVEGDGYTWWNVQVNSTGETGWVASQFLTGP